MHSAALALSLEQWSRKNLSRSFQRASQGGRTSGLGNICAERLKNKSSGAVIGLAGTVASLKPGVKFAVAVRVDAWISA